MGLEHLSSLYQTVIMDHYQHPRNQGKLDQATHRMELLNPTCGDAIVVECRVENSVIEDIAFSGYGCAISMASASMMTQAMKGKEINQAKALVESFNALIGGQSESCLDSKQLKSEIKEAMLLENIKQFPARYKCAILAWRALEKGLNHEESGEAI